MSSSKGEGGSVAFWDANTGRELVRLPVSGGFGGCVAFSPQGDTVVCGTEDGVVRLWDIVSVTELRTLAKMDGDVSLCSISPDGA